MLNRKKDLLKSFNFEFNLKMIFKIVLFLIPNINSFCFSSNGFGLFGYLCNSFNWPIPSSRTNIRGKCSAGSTKANNHKINSSGGGKRIGSMGRQ
jgi:hypothetical protein